MTNGGTVTSDGILIELQLGDNILGTSLGPDYVVVRIRADKEWTGYLDRVSIRWSVP